jgi:hypothetical protein
MGLGEYIYIFALAYQEHYCATTHPDFEGEREVVKRRTRLELAQILRNQLAVLDASHTAADADEASLIETEIAALEDGSHIVPWQDGLPPAIAECFAPYTDQLEELFCQAALPFELTQKNKRFAGIGE